MEKKVLVPISDGIEELEAIGIIDTLRRADAKVTVASVDGLQITASCGTKIIADTLIENCINKEYDLIALPGGLPGAEHLRDSKVLTSLLKKQVADGKLYAAICASPVVVLQYHGLLKGKKATVNPALADKLIIKDNIENIASDIAKVVIKDIPACEAGVVPEIHNNVPKCIPEELDEKVQRRDWWMNGKEAKKLGFANGYIK